MRNITHATKALVCDRYIAGESSTTIAKTTGLGVTTIMRILEGNGIPRRHDNAHSRRYTCDERFFQTIDTEAKAYWLGFLAADGSIDESKNSVIFVLHRKDADSVYAFRDALSATNPVAFYGGERTPQAKIVIVSKEMVNDLKAHGLIPPLSFGIQWPNLPHDLLRHFLRGYSDGDGSLIAAVRKNRPSLAHHFNLCGPIEFMTEVERYMRANGFNQRPFQKAPKHVDRRIVYLDYGGRLQVQKAVHLLYDNATIYLARKHATAMSFLEMPVTTEKTTWGREDGQSTIIEDKRRPIRVCAWCGTAFQAKTAWSKRRYCSRSCAAFARHSP